MFVAILTTLENKDFTVDKPFDTDDYVDIIRDKFIFLMAENERGSTSQPVNSSGSASGWDSRVEMHRRSRNPEDVQLPTGNAALCKTTYGTVGTKPPKQGENLTLHSFYPAGTPGTKEYWRNLEKLLRLLKANNLTLRQDALLHVDREPILGFVRKTRTNYGLANPTTSNRTSKLMTTLSNIEAISEQIDKEIE